jgi:hypothetical protein
VTLRRGAPTPLIPLNRPWRFAGDVVHNAPEEIPCASAGTGEAALLGAITEQHFDATFNLNARGTLFTVSAFRRYVVSLFVAATHATDLANPQAMTPENREKLNQRIRQAAEAALSDKEYVSAIDVLIGIGWLAPSNVDAWRHKRIDYLERVVNANLSRISEAMHLFRSWATAKGLQASEADYVARQPGRPALRFSKSGDPNIERQYRMHWMSPELKEKARQRLVEKMNRPPELVAIVPLKADWKCHRCGRGGDLLIMEPPGPCCLKCAGFADLDYLPRGHTKLTKRVAKLSERKLVVVRFSRARKRYERQGLLVEPRALREGRKELGLDEADDDYA